MADDDRVHMTASTVFHNRMIEADKPGANPHTVEPDQGFTTSEFHAKDLERLSFAVRSKGEAKPMSEQATRLRGSQTSNNDAIQSNRITKTI